MSHYISSNYDGFETKEEVNGILNLRVPIHKLFHKRYPLIKHNKVLKEVMVELDKYEIDPSSSTITFVIPEGFLENKTGTKYNLACEVTL